MINPVVNYFLPFIPIITRLIVCLVYRRKMSVELPEVAQERDVVRAYILSLAGFSFTAAAGFAVLDASARIPLQLPTWYVLVSFVFYFGTFNLHSYQYQRWHSQCATAFAEVGTLSLMLALVAVLFTAAFDFWFQIVATVLTLGAWGWDHLHRLNLERKYLAEV
jgi:hypothetical protein